MSGGEQIRRLRPWELARQDQYEAWASEQGQQNPDTVVVMRTFATDGLDCCWCDCTAQQHREDKSACPGCSNEAQYVLQVFKGTPDARAVSVCQEHHEDLVRHLRAWLNHTFGDVPHETIPIEVLDEDVTG
jgi:hypothetical protein